MENDLIRRKDLAEGLACHKQYTDQKYETARQWALGYNAGIERALFSIQHARAVEAEPVRHGRWVLETNSGYRDSYFEDYILVVSITAKCSECGENHGRTGHVYGDDFMGEEDGKRPVENVEEKIEQTRYKYLDWLRSGRCKLMNYCPICGCKMDGGAEG